MIKSRKSKTPFIIYFFLAIVIFGCASSYEMFTVRNRNNLALLEPGMSKEEVAKIMGNESLKGNGAYVANPYKTEVFKTNYGENISVFWYYTQLNTYNGHVDDDELTPVVFKNGKLEGYGWSFYRDTHQHIDINIKTN